MIALKNQENLNYAAKVFQVEKIIEHPNANALVFVLVDGFRVITSNTCKVGDYYVYFPLECALNADYLTWTNSYSSAEMNKNPEKKGFFPKAGRVRMVKLRGEYSEGYCVPVSSVQDWLYNSPGININLNDYCGKSFDSINDILICQKYIKPIQKSENRLENKLNKKKVKKFDRVIPEQYRLTLDTEHLKRNLHLLESDQRIYITSKFHGSAISMGKVLCKRKLSFVDRVAKFFGAQIQELEYDTLYASRRVVKNAFKGQNPVHYYKEDVWSSAVEKYKDCLLPGITIYGELVGQSSEGRWIQKHYDYGCHDNQSEVYVYRITYTNAGGSVFEFSWDQVKRYCEKYGMKIVPEFYYGKLKDKYPEIDYSDRGWRDVFLSKLIEEYLEKDCSYCKNNVPDEGVVLAVEGFYFQPFKLKSLKFLERETKILDEEKDDSIHEAGE